MDHQPKSKRASRTAGLTSGRPRPTRRLSPRGPTRGVRRRRPKPYRSESISLGRERTISVMRNIARERCADQRWDRGARSGCRARVCKTPSQYALRRAYCRDRDRSIPQSRKWSGTPGTASAHRHTAKRRKASNRDGQKQRSQKEIRVPHHKVSAPPDGFQHSIDRHSSTPIRSSSRQCQRRE